jgi:MbtH protein
MTRPLNPFDDEQGTYLVLANDHGQHSLWPAGIDVPAGWAVVHGADSRAACLAYVDEHWTGLRPAPAGRSGGGPS